jgi:hypothetical protein
LLQNGASRACLPWGGGFKIVPTTTNPVCAASADVGKIWVDSTSATDTAYKVCLVVGSAYTWVTK